MVEILAECNPAPFPTNRPLTGADETLEEGFIGLMAQGATIEYSMMPGSAYVSIGIRYKDGEQTVKPDAES